MLLELSNTGFTFGRAGNLLLISIGDGTPLEIHIAGLTACPFVPMFLTLLGPLARHLAYCVALVADPVSPVNVVSELTGRLPGQLLRRLPGRLLLKLLFVL